MEYTKYECGGDEFRLELIVVLCVQVTDVAPKPAVVQTLSAVTDHGGQSHFQAAITDVKKERPPTYTKVSPPRSSTVYILLYEQQPKPAARLTFYM